jgi:hypothetical protein
MSVKLWIAAGAALAIAVPAFSKSSPSPTMPTAPIPYDQLKSMGDTGHHKGHQGRHHGAKKSSTVKSADKPATPPSQ